MSLDIALGSDSDIRTVLIADDHPLFRAAMRDILDRLYAAKGWSMTCREASCFEEAYEIARANPDLELVSLDVCMPDSSDLSGLLRFRSELPALPVVVVSALEDTATIHRTMLCGAAGFVPKSASADAIRGALATVLEGGLYMPPNLARQEPASAHAGAAPPSGHALTPRQAAVLAKLVEGKSNKVIARELAISDMTVKVHVTAILRSLDVETRAQAIVAVRGERVGERQAAGS